jgi:conjugal transfer/entry exclusion protein
MKQHILKMAVALTLLVPVSAFAGTLAGGVTMPEQIVQEATMVKQYTQRVGTIKIGIKKVYDAAQNLHSVPNKLWQQGQQYLGQLANLTRQAQSLALGGQNMSIQFEQQNGYSAVALATQRQYKQLCIAFNREQRALQTVKNEPVSGRLQALVVGNQVAGAVATELGQLGAIVAQQQKSQGAHQVTKATVERQQPES